MSQSEISFKKFQIVERICPGRKTVPRKLDIVPYKWLDVEKKNSKFNLKCCFPPSNYELVPQLVKEEQEPDFNWKLYSVLIETYEKAEEHYKKIEVGLSQRGYSTTDSENKGDHDEKEETIRQELIRSKFQAQEAAMNKEALKEKTKNNLAVLLEDDGDLAQTMTNETSDRSSCGNSWNSDVTVEP
ncbi:hypothetical protein HCN44_003472 [Aphidius gifuensis]|uniref:Uncharacterized protein n=1 Tax=Aphidius gifuensis TaxID=684658 RepID=A0A834XLL8_APHGI|nr:hypothetical protein HCN44_003472 [Aphidius gifuensis]